MRIVVDTNVFISACIGRGDASKVIEACIEGRAVPLIGKALYLEYEDVIARDDIFRRARLNLAERNALFDIFLGKCDRPDVYFRWRPNLSDESDNHIMDLAVAGNARFVITSNTRDFRGAELRFEHIAVVSPTRFLEELNR
ncbi:putative toxin-antitoxin system toxin component, PIN family [Rhizobium sp. CG5]|uniref:putative toxin-antitoxin system toxin component, PIN family n=1 Tax=Rhizobium sp. CG5 TaxID=2726076 RepID=UPI002033F5C2|nr:putative toxin-antitoxin system toxin component, PIN family [Rhizobium sp. CG5]MCM2476955.1 putative toxin-antitoxin system toxin component, PIN family [Rhizobium sp. CG5]